MSFKFQCHRRCEKRTLRWLGGLVILAGLGLLLQGVWWGSEEHVESAEDSLVQLSQEVALEPAQVNSVEPEMDKTHQATMKGILDTDPLPEETIASDQPIAIQFSQPVDLSGVQPAKNVQLYPSNDLDGIASDGFFNTEVRYGHDGQGNEQKDMLVFTPSFPFQSGQTYRLIVRAGEPFPLEEDFVLTFNVQ